MPNGHTSASSDSATGAPRANTTELIEQGLKAARSRASATPRLILTGERMRKRYLAIVDLRVVWLPGTLFGALCRLVLARHRTRTGFARESPLTAHRLRELLDSEEDRRAGRSIIETGDGHEYRLALEPRHLRVHATFADCPTRGLIAETDRQALLNFDSTARKSD